MTEKNSERKDAAPISEVAAGEARDRLTELVDRARYMGERIIITRHGKPLAVLVGMADLDRLEKSAAA
jgi:prevent-host-death family protein